MNTIFNLFYYIIINFDRQVLSDLTYFLEKFFFIPTLRETKKIFLDVTPNSNLLNMKILGADDLMCILYSKIYCIMLGKHFR